MPSGTRIILLFPSLPLLRKPPEKTLLVPLGPCRLVRDGFSEQQHHPVEIRGGFQIHRLLHVVRWRMIALSQPLLGDGLFRGTLFITDFEEEGRHSLTDEVVLVAADEDVALRLDVPLDANAQGLGNRARLPSKVRFIQAVDGQNVQREQRQKHIHI